MGNTNAKPHPRPRNKKQVHWKAADRPAPPGKPALIITTETSDSLTIRWDLPLKDGGSPITGYLVEYRRYGSSNWLRATQSLCTYPELNVKGLEAGWRYQFRVYAENVVGMSDPSQLSEPMTMMFQKSDITAPRFLEELQDTIALENDKVEFVVHFVGQPAPKVSWYKDGFEIFSSRRTRIVTENDKSILIIHQSAMSDEGEIKCTITNRAGHGSTRALLTLEAPPSIRLPRQYEDGLLFEIGEVIRLKISIAGRPAPLVFWSQNGESIQNGERYEIENTDRTSILRVGEARRTDRGEYQIKAVNKLGEDLASFLVTVTDRPSPPGKAKVIMTLGRSVTLSWHTPNDDGGCKIGNYIIEYFRIGWNVWLKAATTRQLSTILGDLIEGSEYKFRVKAESPYGVSEPSEESDTIFIPDPKRGMLIPPSRGRSQQKITPPTTPVAAQRKKRSQSSTRTEEKPLFDTHGIPIRPERIKTKSSPSTPEMSPRVHRKIDSNTLNNQIFDRASMARELAYGSPEIKVKKVENYHQNNIEDAPLRHNYSKIETSQTRVEDSTRGDVKMNHAIPEKKLLSEKERSRSRSRSPSPMKQLKEIKQKSLLLLRKSRSPSPGKISNKSPSPRLDKRRKSENDENLSGSTEFMLVLYPELHGKGQRETSVMSFDLEDIPVPPPLSLSAPELGIEPPLIEGLKLSASSTELLHERAMIRFYEEAAAEEAEIEKFKQQSGERKQSIIPKIQINSKDDEDIVGLETKHSLRRRLSAGGTLPQQVLWAQRRHSLRNSSEIADIGDSRLYKFPVPLDSNKIKKFKEEEELKKTEENVYDEVEGTDYEELTESEDEYIHKRYKDDEPIRRFEEEDETYHPRQMISKKDQPFEILNKPNKLPDPNFVPKPILKKRDEANVRNIRLDPGYISRERSKSLATDQLQDAANLFKYKTSEENLGSRQRSFSLIPTTDNTNPLPERRGSFSALACLGQTVAAVATISGIAAAGVIIPNTLLDKKNDEEEAKVVVDHYSDIVNTYNIKRKTFPPPSPQQERKKSVNNIFSVKQVQKQQSVDEDSYDKFLQKLKSEEEEIKEERKEKELIEEAAVQETTSENLNKKAEYMNRVAEDAMKPDVSVKADVDKPLGMWDKAMGFFYTTPKTNEDTATEQVVAAEQDNSVPGGESLKNEKSFADNVAEKFEDNEKQIHTTSLANNTSVEKNQLKAATIPVIQASKEDNFLDNVNSKTLTIDELRLQKKFEPQITRESRSDLDYSRRRTQSRSPTRTANSSMPRSSSAAPVQDMRNKYRKSSPSPSPSNSRTRKSSSSPSPSNLRLRKSTPSPSTNVKMRKSSPSPVPFHRISTSSNTPSPLHLYSSISRSSLSRSPSPTSSVPSSISSWAHKTRIKRPPMMKEIMTQTSNAIDPYKNESVQTISHHQQELTEKADVVVKNSVEYITDLVLFFAACYLYIFSNELLVIPILIILVYRQLKDAIKERIPNWMKRKPKETNQ